MKRIKKFFELFDTDELKSFHEIDYLSGNLDVGSWEITNNFKDESMAKFISKCSMYQPFFIAFDESVEKGTLDFGDFEVFAHYDEDIDYWALVARSETKAVSFFVRVIEVNKYDIAIFYGLRDNSEEDEEFEYENIDLNRVVQLINGVYIPFLKEAGFDKLINYQSEYKKTIGN